MRAVLLPIPYSTMMITYICQSDILVQDGEIGPSQAVNICGGESGREHGLLDGDSDHGG